MTNSNLNKTKQQDYSDFTSNLIYEIFQVSAIVDCIRALSFEIEEDHNASITRSLLVVKDQLSALAAEVDRTSFDYELKQLES